MTAENVCRRASTDAGPDFCAPCSAAVGEWVMWDSDHLAEVREHSRWARDRLHQLEAENDRLREVLRPFAKAYWRKVHPGRPAFDGGFFLPEDVAAAQAAWEDRP